MGKSWNIDDKLLIFTVGFCPKISTASSSASDASPDAMGITTDLEVAPFSISCFSMSRHVKKWVPILIWCLTICIRDMMVDGLEIDKNGVCRYYRYFKICSVLILHLFGRCQLIFVNRPIFSQRKARTFNSSEANNHVFMTGWKQHVYESQRWPFLISSWLVLKSRESNEVGIHRNMLDKPKAFHPSLTCAMLHALGVSRNQWWYTIMAIQHRLQTGTSTAIPVLGICWSRWLKVWHL